MKVEYRWTTGNGNSQKIGKSDSEHGGPKKEIEFVVSTYRLIPSGQIEDDTHLPYIV